MKQIIGFSVVLLTVAVVQATGIVILLRGTGCAGKTSICKEITRFSEWRVVDEDAIYYERAALRWKELFPQEYACIEAAIDPQNILHAVMRNQILYRHGLTEDARTQAYLAIQTIQNNLNNEDEVIRAKNKEWHAQLAKYIIEEIKNLAQSHNVIVDTWFLKQDHIADIKTVCIVKEVLAYCPFDCLVKRTIARNASALINGADISCMRFFHQALMSFLNRFELADAAEGAIDLVSKSDLEHALNLVELARTESHTATGSVKLFTRGEFSSGQFEEYKDKLLSKFVLKEQLYLVPKMPYELLIKTNQLSPVESATLIIKLAANNT